MIENEKKQVAASVDEQVVFDQENKLTIEQKAELERLFKHVEVAPLNDDLSALTTKAIKVLNELKQEILDKKKGAVEKQNLIQSKIADLKTFNGITVDENEYKKSEVGVEEFVSLLDYMTEEVSSDVNFYSSLLSDSPPKAVWILKSEPDTFSQYLTNRLKHVNKYVRSARRDLSVSYSRYCYGFDAQIKQIGFVEQYLKNAESRKKVVTD